MQYHVNFNQYYGDWLEQLPFVLEEISDVLEEQEFDIFHKIDSIPSANINFVSADRIKELNREFRSADEITDVLTFGGVEAPEISEIYISIDGIRSKAPSEFTDDNNYIYNEVVRSLLHGLLHLSGMDHSDSMEHGDEAAALDGRHGEMFRVQEEILNKVLR